MIKNTLWKENQLDDSSKMGILLISKFKPSPLSSLIILFEIF